MTASVKYSEAAQRRGRETHLAFASSARKKKRELYEQACATALEEGAKTCTKCGAYKSLEEFALQAQRLDGRNTRCKSCRRQEWRQVDPVKRRAKNRAAALRFRYGVDEVLAQHLYEQQEGCCAICGMHGDPPLIPDSRGKTLSIDHDHESGMVRGLLCFKCNTALGKFGDSVDLLVKAAAYLVDRGGQST